jgi:hypothetical protein
MEHTVFTVPCNKPWVLTKEEAEIFLKDAPTRRATKEERAEIKKRADRWRKPEKKDE